MKDKCLLVPALYAYLIEKTVDFEVDAIKQYVYDKLRYRSAHRCAKADPERYIYHYRIDPFFG